MILNRSTLILKTAILLFSTGLSAQIETKAPESDTGAISTNPLPVISINLNSENDGWDSEEADTSDYQEEHFSQEVSTAHDSGVPIETSNESDYEAILDQSESTAVFEHKLPGEELNFRLKIHTSTHHFINGKAQSDLGKIRFKSRLMPSNEVKLSLKLKQKELADVELIAYFDLANFTMELDGANSVLNKGHKQTLKLVSSHLKDKFIKQYEGYELPEHALMLVQMLGYWSMSPEGYIHEKRSIVSQ